MLRLTKLALCLLTFDIVNRKAILVLKLLAKLIDKPCFILYIVVENEKKEANLMDKSRIRTCRKLEKDSCFSAFPPMQIYPKQISRRGLYKFYLPLGEVEMLIFAVVKLLYIYSKNLYGVWSA